MQALTSRCAPSLALLTVFAALAGDVAHGQCTTHSFESPAGGSGLFGQDLALEGDVLAIGAPKSGSGSVAVYERSDAGTPLDPTDDAWPMVAVLHPGTPPGGLTTFGTSVALSQGRLAVGHFGADRAVLYGSVGGTWSEVATLSKPAELDFGREVALDGGTLVVGGLGDGTHGTSAGAAWFFAVDAQGTADPLDDTWVELGKVFASDDSPGARFGNAVSISGDTALIGAFTDGAAGVEAGAAYVFSRDGHGTADPLDDTWVEIAKLVPPGTDAGDEVGWNVAIDGHLALVSAWKPGQSGSAVHVYRRADPGTPADPLDDAWLHDAVLQSSSPWAGPGFGRGLALSDGVAAVAAGSALPGVGLGTGVVVPFVLQGFATPTPADDVWVELAVIVPDGLTSGALLGNGLAVAGTEIAIGAPFQHGDQGMPAEGIAFIGNLTVGGCWTPLSPGLKGGGNFVPELHGEGQPAPGGIVTVEVTRALGGASGFLAIGSSLAQVPLFGGIVCAWPDVALVPHTLPGGFGWFEFGHATFTFTLPNDPALVGVRAYLQALYLDPWAVQGVSMTRGLELRIG